MQDLEKLCELCQKQGKHSVLHTYQINFNEAVTLCDNSQCPYPVGLGQSSGFITPRGLANVPSIIPDAEGRQSTLSTASSRKSRFKKRGQSVCETQQQQTTRSLSSVSQLQRRQSLPELQGKRNALSTNGESDTALQKDSPALSKNQGLATGPNPQESLFKQTGLSTTQSPCNATIPSVSSSYPSVVLNGVDASNPIDNGLKPSNGHISQSANKSFNSSSSKNGVQSQSTRGSQAFAAFKFGQRTDHLQTTEACLVKQGSTGTTGSVKLSQISFKNDEQDELGERIQFLQWKNREALCWLDVILCLLVNNNVMRKILDTSSCDRGDSLLKKVFIAHQQAQQIVNNNFHVTKCDSSKQHSDLARQTVKALKMVKKGQSIVSPLVEILTESEMSARIESHCDKSSRGQLPPVNFQTGAGCKTTTEKSLFANETDSRAAQLLDGVRESVWQALKPRLHCEKGRNDSPVFAYPLIVKAEKRLERALEMKCQFEFVCPGCGDTEKQAVKTLIPSIPKVVENFSISRPTHYRTCLKCGAKHGKRSMIYQSLPETFLMHYIDGLNEGDVTRLDLRFGGSLYTVTGLVQYSRDPDHFIAWLRNAKDGRWMECNDLKSPLCNYTHDVPDFPSKEIHIVMWEKSCVPVPSTGNWRLAGKRQPVSVSAMVPVSARLTVTSDSSSVNMRVNAQGLATQSMVSVGGQVSPCSSLSSACSELSDICDLPNFTTAVPATLATLVKPLPCKTALSSQESAAKGGNSNKLVAKERDSNPFMSQVSGATPVLKPSSVFCVPGRSACQKQSANVASADSSVNGQTVSKSLINPCDINQSVADSVNMQSNVNSLSQRACVIKTKEAVSPDDSAKIAASLPTALPQKLAENKDIVSLLSRHKNYTIEKCKGAFIIKLKPEKNVQLPKQLAKFGAMTIGRGDISSTPAKSTVQTSDRDGKRSPQTNGEGIKMPGHGRVKPEIQSSVVNTIGPVSSSSTAVCGSERKASHEESGSVFKTPASKLAGRQRFHPDISFRTNKTSSVSRDAFMTLKTLGKRKETDVGKSSLSVSNQNGSSLSHGASTPEGSTTLLSSVKQYLLSKTTSESKPKFQGFSLKSAKKEDSNGRTCRGMMDGGVTLPSVLLGGVKPRETTPVRPRSNSSDSSAELKGSAVSRKRILLEAGPGAVGAKRMCKENRTSPDCLPSRTFTQLKGKPVSSVNSQDKLSSPSVVNDKSPGSISVGASEADSQECNVLQDLYQALNIPFSDFTSMTQHDMMEGADDFLDLLQSGPSPDNLTSTGSVAGLVEAGSRGEGS